MTITQEFFHAQVDFPFKDWHSTAFKICGMSRTYTESEKVCGIALRATCTLLWTIWSWKHRVDTRSFLNIHIGKCCTTFYMEQSCRHLAIKGVEYVFRNHYWTQVTQAAVPAGPVIGVCLMKECNADVLTNDGICYVGSQYRQFILHGSPHAEACLFSVRHSYSKKYTSLLLMISKSVRMKFVREVERYVAGQKAPSDPPEMPIQ